jgi:hypothetical protein
MPALTFPNGRKQYVLQRISDQAIIKRGAQYPTTEDDGPIDGLDPDLRYLEMWRDARPDEDVRIWSVTADEVVEPVEEDGPDVFHIKWAVAKRPVDDIKHAAKNTESARNKEQLPDSESTKLILFGLGILLKRLDNQTLTQREQNIASKITDRIAAIRKHDTRLAQILAAVDQGETPDLDTGWEPAPTE